MRVIEYPPRETWPNLCRRPSIDTEVLSKTVAEILKEVRENGDKALRRYGRKFDRVDLDDFRVSEAEFENANDLVPQDLKDAIAAAKANIETFHRLPKQESREVIETTPGVFCWRKTLPIQSVGLYVPAGSASLFSTVLMLASPAKLAGCERVVIVTPPSADGKASAEILYTARLCGVSDVYKIGGAQAIGALAFGTDSVPKVDKIFGPGNQYVTEAKLQILRSGVSIDMPAGPSEVAILADHNSTPEFVAADLLAQAEHGPDSQVVLISTERSVIDAVKDAVDLQLEMLPRRDVARTALSNSIAVLFATIDEALAFLDTYAAEHVIIATKDAESDADKLRNGGSVFIGNYSCESAGDYASGTNHTLPTGGAARSYSGVSTRDFMKTITYQRLTADGIRNLGPIVETMAAAEGLDAHRNAMAIRREFLGGRDDV